MELYRNLYHQSINAVRGKGMITVLTGQRRSGKSTILRQCIAHSSPGILLDMEYYPNKHYQDDDALYAYLVDGCETQGWKTVGIGEVQIIAGREKVLVSLAKTFPHIDFFVTGSNSYFHTSACPRVVYHFIKNLLGPGWIGRDFFL